MKNIGPAMLLAMLAGCATPPDKIAAAPTDAAPYAAMSCDQLGAEFVRITTDLEPLLATQNNARSADVAGVILIGLPVGTMANPGAEQRVADIARLKGERDAVTAARTRGGCN